MYRFLLSIAIVIAACGVANGQTEQQAKDHYDTAVARIDKLAKIKIEQARKFGWEDDIPKIKAEQKKQLTAAEADYINALLIVFRNDHLRVAAIVPSHKSSAEYSAAVESKAAEELVLKAKADADREAAMIEKSEQDKQAKNERLIEGRKRMLRDHAPWESSKEVDEFGDTTGTETYSLRVKGTMQNSATDNAKADLVVFYQPTGGRLTFNIYDYGRSPVTLIGNSSLSLSAKLDTGQVLKFGQMTGTKTFRAHTEATRSLIKHLKEGAVVRLAFTGRSYSKWNFIISGRNFPGGIK